MSSNSKEEISSRCSQEKTVTDPVEGGQKMNEMNVTPGHDSLTIHNLSNHNTAMGGDFEADIIPGRRRLDRQAIDHYIAQVVDHSINSSAAGRPEAALFGRVSQPQLRIRNVERSSAQVVDNDMNPISGFQVVNVDSLDPTIGDNTADTANEPNETKAERMLRRRAERPSIIRVPTVTNTTVIAVIGRGNTIRRDLRQKPSGEFVRLIAAEKVSSNQASGVMICNSPITRGIGSNEPTKEFNCGDEGGSETEEGKGKGKKILVEVGKAYDGKITRVLAGEESDSEYSEGEAEKFDALEKKYALANMDGT
ncbi:hypothetical protein Q9L58_006652 [Maublancomyces gigas]|uniref:Uncharacterized protein n=1 Tax=Discina gigas TaxID=1032678 RepID=A0ABR3GEL5_9PEZI